MLSKGVGCNPRTAASWRASSQSCNLPLQARCKPEIKKHPKCFLNAAKMPCGASRRSFVQSRAAQHDDRSAPDLPTAATEAQNNKNWCWQLMSRLIGYCAAVALINSLIPAAAQAAAAAARGSSASPIAVMIDFLLHLDHHMSGIIAAHGHATYAILWAIVFCETGLVLTPFLPGDSLLFAAGAFAGLGQLSLPILFAVFLSSAILGDAVNYAIGNKMGGWALEKKLLKREYIEKTEQFYAKYGGKTVVLARFVPIVRTFAPFVAGIGTMPYGTFAMYNVGGALLWTVLFVGAGYLLGNVPFVQKNFTAVVLAIVAISVVPVLVEVWQARQEAAGEQRKSGGSGGSSAPA